MIGLVWQATRSIPTTTCLSRQNRNELFTDKVFAGLAVVIVIGLLVEDLVFDTLERPTIRHWGMLR